MSVLIHGKTYITVAERLQEARPDIKSIVTEVVSHEPLVVIKATVTVSRGVYTGISAANTSKSIEKASPYEVAETSAVGRALGFAGYGATESIASAEEMEKIPDPTDNWATEAEEANTKTDLNKALGKCSKCGADNKISKQGKVYCGATCWLNK
jgi:Zn-dependent alcohol dehydrogenase